MEREMKIFSWTDGYEWCMENGYEFLGIDVDNAGDLVMHYEDGKMPPMSKKEEEYIEKQLRQQEKERKKELEKLEVWVIASDDGYCSRMFKGKGRNQYTFYISEAATYTKSEAQKRAVMMTRNSKVGRIWFGLRIK